VIPSPTLSFILSSGLLYLRSVPRMFLRRPAVSVPDFSSLAATCPPYHSQTEVADDLNVRTPTGMGVSSIMSSIESDTYLISCFYPDPVGFGYPSTSSPARSHVFQTPTISLNILCDIFIAHRSTPSFISV
jgi:hypothetical protein